MKVKENLEQYIYIVGAITVAYAAANVLYRVTKPVVKALDRKINHKEEA
jgi:predicted PurR-regulated permease PerM